MFNEAIIVLNCFSIVDMQFVVKLLSLSIIKLLASIYIHHELMHNRLF